MAHTAPGSLAASLNQQLQPRPQIDLPSLSGKQGFFLTRSQIPFCESAVVTSLVGVQRKVTEIWNKKSPPPSATQKPGQPQLHLQPHSCLLRGHGQPAQCVLPWESTHTCTRPDTVFLFIVQRNGPGEIFLKTIVMSGLRPPPSWHNVYGVQLGHWDFEEPHKWFC